MRFYQEITLVETFEVTPYFIWSKLYTQLHLALVEQQNPDKTVNFGVSFPNYINSNKDGTVRRTLGNKLRVFADSYEALQRLNLYKWLERLSDYVHIKGIRAVPEHLNGHLLVKRYRADFNLDRLTRRFMRRESIRTGTEISFLRARELQNQRHDENRKLGVLEQKGGLKARAQDFPFIKLRSLSGSREFSLQIEQIVTNEAKAGVFSTYGLSSQATVPHW